MLVSPHCIGLPYERVIPFKVKVYPLIKGGFCAPVRAKERQACAILFLGSASVNIFLTSHFEVRELRWRSTLNLRQSPSIDLSFISHWGSQLNPTHMSTHIKQKHTAFRRPKGQLPNITSTNQNTGKENWRIRHSTFIQWNHCIQWHHCEQRQGTSL